MSITKNIQFWKRYNQHNIYDSNLQKLKLQNPNFKMGAIKWKLKIKVRDIFTMKQGSSARLHK